MYGFIASGHHMGFALYGTPQVFPFGSSQNRHYIIIIWAQYGFSPQAHLGTSPGFPPWLQSGTIKASSPGQAISSV